MGSAPGKIGDVQPFAELAQGATTVVYKGYQRALDRFVLLKVLRPDLAHDAERVRRFDDEARLIAQVQHPNVVAIYGSGSDRGQAYIAAEFVDGFDLRDLIARGPLPVELATMVILEAARGLQAAHAHGILHRDLKPSNILVSHEGLVKLTDFGMASLLDDAPGAAEVRGTPGYLAPELVRGAPPAKASDLFSLGATYYEALAGRPAFTGTDTGVLLDAVLHHDPLPRLERFTDLPPELYRICARMLVKDPAARYPDAGTLVADLETFLATFCVPAEAASLKAYLDDPDAYVQRRNAQVAAEAATAEAGAVREDRQPIRLAPRASKRRNYWAWGIGLAALLVGGLGGTLLIKGDSPSPPQPTAGIEEAVMPLPEADTSRQVVGAAPGEQGADTLVAQTPPMTVQASETPAAGDPSGEDVPETLPLDPGDLDSGDTLTVDAGTGDEAENGAPEVVAEPVAAAGSLFVAVQPWAEVYVDEERKGEAPPNLSFSVPAGKHRVVLRHRSLPEYAEEVEVRAGETTSLNVSLWNLVGRYAINAQPWAEVLVDMAVRDTTPVHELIVWPGEHRLTLRNPGLGAWDTTLVVQGGETQTLLIDLTNKRLRR